MKRKQPSKTETALNLIKYDFAKNGKDTGIAGNAFIETRISYRKFQEMAIAGLKQFKR